MTTINKLFLLTFFLVVALSNVAPRAHAVAVTIEQPPLAKRLTTWLEKRAPQGPGGKDDHHDDPQGSAIINGQVQSQAGIDHDGDGRVKGQGGGQLTLNDTSRDRANQLVNLYETNPTLAAQRVGSDAALRDLISQTSAADPNFAAELQHEFREEFGQQQGDTYYAAVSQALNLPATPTSTISGTTVVPGTTSPSGGAIIPGQTGTGVIQGTTGSGTVPGAPGTVAGSSVFNNSNRPPLRDGAPAGLTVVRSTVVGAVLAVIVVLTFF